MDKSGVDSDGNVFSSPQELWEAVKRDPKSPWYRKAVEHWDAQEASDNGVLGGFGHVNEVDIRDSRLLLQKAFGSALTERKDLVALDCGAGVGRVTEHLLLPHFTEVDLVEPSAHLLEAAKKRLRPRRGGAVPAGHRAVGFFHSGLEGFVPEPARYDAMWVQWAMLYLTDEDALAFLRRCVAGLRPGGLIFIKENVCDSGFVVDNDDYSITRSNAYYLELFSQAGLVLRHTALQRGFPRGLYKVRMYALAPRPDGEGGRPEEVVQAAEAKGAGPKAGAKEAAPKAEVEKAEPKGPEPKKAGQKRAGAKAAGAK